MLSTEVITEIARVAAEANIEPAALLAVAEVETGGKAYAIINGRKEPLIRFEGHYFDRRLNGVKRDNARRAGLASPRAGEVANPASQASRWKMLDKAAAIDRKAAYESVSWGLGQVMGAHWAWLGFANVDALAAEARGDAGGQARLMVRYIAKAGLDAALSDRDWHKFAHGYNGPAYRKNGYHTRLANAYRRYARSADDNATAPMPPSSLRRGDRGSSVLDLQLVLSAAGYPLSADGQFGPLTDAALSRFQQDNGLVVDGIAGPQTMSALRTRLSFSARLKTWWSRVRTLFGI